MEVTFWGVRGSIPSPGPATVRYGGNTSCVSVRLSGGELVVLDCGTGARNLGLALLAGPLGRGAGSATLLLSHAHWDHIQGFPFFSPFYVEGNAFTVYGGANAPGLLEEVLERQMAAQYFPVQTLRNMGARIEMRSLRAGDVAAVGAATITAAETPHGRMPALAFRIQDGDRALAYVSDAGYDPAGPTAAVLDLCRGADLLIHDCSFTPEDRARQLDRGLSSLDDALACATGAGARRLALFHYDQDYNDAQVDDLIARGRRAAPDGLDVFGAAEGLTVVV